MKALPITSALAFLLTLAVAPAGALSVSNQKGFDSNPVVDRAGVLQSGNTGVYATIGTFASEPSAAIPGTSETVDGLAYLALIAEFTQYGVPAALLRPGAPLNLHGVFSFQGNAPVDSTPLAGKPVYVLITKGGQLENATEVAILRTNAVFEAADDESPFPKLVGVGTTLGTTVIIGSQTRFTASATTLDATPEAAYSLAQVLAPPEIVVGVTPGEELGDGRDTVDLGTVLTGDYSERILTITNTGGTDLLLNGLPTVIIDGPNASDFTVSVAPATAVAPSSSTSLTLRFEPSGDGFKSAALHIANNDADENPFDLDLAGLALSSVNDTDGDGLNDAAEWLMSDLGFNWQVAQEDLVDTLFDNANVAGLYTQDQLQALKPDTALIAKDQTTDLFTLTVDWKKSADLLTFDDFPAQPSEVSVNELGDIEFEFATPDPVEFFRLEF